MYTPLAVTCLPVSTVLLSSVNSADNFNLGLGVLIVCGRFGRRCQ